MTLREVKENLGKRVVLCLPLKIAEEVTLMAIDEDNPEWVFIQEDGGMRSKVSRMHIFFSPTDPKLAAMDRVGELLPDEVNHPDHYKKGKVECIDAIESAVEGLDGAEAVLTGYIIKYIFRWKWKGGIEDLKKAKRYLERLIEKLTSLV